MPATNKHIRSSNRSRHVLLGWALLIIFGCNTESTPLYPVTGTIIYGGKPVGGAQVAFYGQDEALKAPDAPFPRAFTNPDGSFDLTSNQPNDGAPAGNYAVTIEWRGEASADADPELQDEQPDRLRGRFSDPATTPIQVTIPAEPTTLDPIELKK